MTRQKVKIAFIENDSSRKATYKKRKRGLLKKANELATLCGVPVAVIIDSAYEVSPETWPPTRQEMDKVVSRWQGLPETERTKKMLTQEKYLEQRITKTTETWKKLTKENKDLEMREVLFNCLSGKTSPYLVEKSNLRDFGNVIEQYLKNLNRRIEIITKNDGSSSSLVPPATLTSVDMPNVEMGSSSTAFYDMIRQQQIQNNLEHAVEDSDMDQDEH